LDDLEMKLHIQRSLSEKELIQGCRQGQEKARRRLYELYAGRMLGLCRRYVGDRDTAEDIMIQGFMRVFERIAQYSGEGSFEGWMKRIMINEALGYLRKAKTMYLEVDIEKAEQEPDFGFLESHLEAAELLAMIDRMPTGYKTVFSLYAIEGYNHREIGALLGISENTSKSQLSRARMYLQHQLLERERVEKVNMRQNGK
jgi:RNA polymerase sigma factor (sigma-70 family)